MKYNVIIKPKDLKRYVMRAGGPGGQHQNKTESAVRYVHLPTGIAAESRSDRSQHANDGIALDRLKEKLLAAWLIARGGKAKEIWEAKANPTFGGVQMRTYRLCGNPQVVVDHETGWEGRPRSVLDGQIDELLHARLVEAAKTQWASEAS